MTWVIDPGVKTALGIVGNITALGMFLAPVKTFWRILRVRDVEDFSCLPYLVTFLNCSLWTFYGLPMVTKGATLVSTVNGVGTALAFTYCSIFCTHARGSLRIRTCALLGTEGLLIGMLILITLLAFPFHMRTTFVGVVAVVVTISMYTAPLGKMRQVVCDRSVEYMPFLLSLNVFLNATAWSVYAAYARDIYVLVPNALGVLLGAAQLVLYWCYYKATPVAVGDAERAHKAGSDRGKAVLHKNMSDKELLGRSLSIGDEGGRGSDLGMEGKV